MLEAREKRSRLRLRVAIVPLAPRGAVWGGGEREALLPPPGYRCRAASKIRCPSCCQLSRGGFHRDAPILLAGGLLLGTHRGETKTRATSRMMTWRLPGALSLRLGPSPRTHRCRPATVRSTSCQGGQWNSRSEVRPAGHRAPRRIPSVSQASYPPRRSRLARILQQHLPFSKQFFPRHAVIHVILGRRLRCSLSICCAILFVGSFVCFPM